MHASKIRARKMAPENDAARPTLFAARMAVVSSDGTTLLAKVSFHGKADGEVTVSASGVELQAQEILKLITEVGNSVPRAMPVEQRLGELRRVIGERLRDEGYLVTDLPAADIEFKFALDAEMGLAIATQAALHEHAAPNAELGQHLREAIAGVFTKARDDLATAIVSCADAGNYIGAAQALEAARLDVAFMSAPNGQLLQALERIDVSSLDADLRKTVRECRAAVAAGLSRYDVAARDAEELLKEHPSMKPSERANLENIMAVAAVKRGEVEAALSIWRRLTQRADELDAGLRGWIWRNLSLTLPVQDPAASRAAQLSADAFLEAGDKWQAGTSLMRLSHLLEHKSPAEALEQLDAMLGIMTQKGLLGNELRAAIYHAKGNRYLALRAYAPGLTAALEAVRLRRDVAGAESQLISSLHLGIMHAKSLNNAPQVAELEREVQALESREQSPRFQIARRIQGLFEKFDPQEAESLLHDVRGSDPELIAAAGVAAAMADPDLSVSTRLQRLETVLRELDACGAKAGAKHPAMLAIATLLRQEKEFERAAVWLRRALDQNPLDISLGELLLDTLWQVKDWGSAAIFLKKQIDRLGAKPGLLTAYGRSLLEAGDLSGAVTALTQALKLVGDNATAKAQIEALRNRALDLGGTMLGPEPRPLDTAAVTRAEVEQALKDFSKFVESDKRKGFWTKEPDTDYRWISHPEQRAQDLLHTFFKARFQERISVFEELDTGAGRLDLLLKFQGGLSAIAELKMCGFGYSSAYAAAGETQIRHYMENRDVHLGYLVVHDARLTEFAQPLIAADATGRDTVVEIFVDVRPRVSLRTSLL